MSLTDQLLESTTAIAGASAPPLDEGDYAGKIVKLDLRDGRGKEGEPWYSLSIQLAVKVPQEQQETQGGDEKTCFASMFVDITEVTDIDGSKSLALDWRINKNRRLTALREALGQNQEGVEWSLKDMIGHMVGFKVTHRDYKGVPQEEFSGWHAHEAY